MPRSPVPPLPPRTLSNYVKILAPSAAVRTLYRLYLSLLWRLGAKNNIFAKAPHHMQAPSFLSKKASAPLGVLPTTSFLYCILQYNSPVAVFMRSKPICDRLLLRLPGSFRSKSPGNTQKEWCKPHWQGGHMPLSHAGSSTHFGPGIGSGFITIAGSGVVASVGFLLVGGGAGS